MDLITQLPESNSYNAICVIIDRLTKRAHFIPINNQFSSKDIAQLLYNKVYPLHCKEAKLQAGIKPTALCSAIDKENSIEFPLDSAILYIQLLSWLCTLPPTVLMPVSWLLCHMLWLWLVTMCDVTILWLRSHLLWLCDCHIIFPMLHLSNNLKEKKRKRKGI